MILSLIIVILGLSTFHFFSGKYSYIRGFEILGEKSGHGMGI